MHELVGKNLVKAYGKKRVVNGVTISIHSGEIVGLLGPNGAGKTTTFYMMLGLQDPDEGSVFLDQDELTGAPLHRRARMGLGYLPQEPSAFRKLTVAENLRVVLEGWNLTGNVLKERVQSALDELHIAHLADVEALKLSGGERRRLEIARCLCLRPTFILLDEPFAGIDPIAVADIQKIISQLRKTGIGILITDHNVRETLGICDRVYLIMNGLIEAEGNANEIIHNEKAKKFYLGEGFSI